MNIADLRKDYSTRELSESDVNPDPILQFEAWFSEALDSEINEPNAMALATVDAHGKPSCRIVLLKGFDAEGFVFFTNYLSRKGSDISQNPQAAITFFWHGLERQVRIEGKVEKIPEQDSDLYFELRPEGSKIGAWTSPQSQPISKRELLDNQREFEQKYNGITVPRPPYWGGYIIVPEMIEFWQGRPSRLHDRIVYQKKGNNWTIQRIAP